MSAFDEVTQKVSGAEVQADIEPGASVIVNGKREDWRGKLGHFLRYLAQQLDGRLTLAVEFRTTHPVDVVRQRFCMDKGMECAADLLMVATTESAKLGKRHPNRPKQVADKKRRRRTKNE